jgi:alpha-beta hydrolase superfamily lysophospholipase
MKFVRVSLKIVFLLLFVLAIAALLGPRPTPVALSGVSYDAVPLAVAAQQIITDEQDGSVSREIRQQKIEAIVAGIDADVMDELRDLRCKSSLRWNSLPGDRTETSIVYLHGFSASPDDLNPTLELLAASMQANVLRIRLRGHGLASDGLSQAKASQWLEDAAIARKIGRLIGKRTLLVGMSTGGSIALLSAMQDPEGLLGLALLSPNFEVRNQGPRILTWPWGREIAAIVTGSHRHKWVAESPIRAALWTTDYDLTAAAEMQSIVEAVRSLPLSEMRLPTLVVHSNIDHVVSIEEMQAKFAEIGSPKKQLIPLAGSSRHELAGFAIAPELSPVLADVIASYFQNILASER